jgi:hypothetical protein
MDDRARLELAICVEQMTCAPYWHQDEKDPRLKRAHKWVFDGKVEDIGQGFYSVEGSRPGTSYTLKGNHCECSHASKGPSRWCYHAVAVHLYQEWQRRLSSLGQQPMPLPPTTVDERLAHTPLPAPEETPMDDLPDIVLTDDITDELPDDLEEDGNRESGIGNRGERGTTSSASTDSRDGSEPHAQSASSRMLRSCQVGQLIAALVQAQSQMRNPRLDSTNPHFRVKYASLAAVRDAVTPALAQQGLTITQFPSTEPGAVTCETVLWHTSGQYLGNVLRVPVAKPDAQGYGAALTYARRYGLMALCNVVGDEDDDAEEDTHPVTAQADARNPHPALHEITYLLRQAGRSDEQVATYWKRTCERCKVARPEEIPPAWQARLLDEVQARLQQTREEGI